MTCDGIGPGFSRVPSSLAHAGSAERFFGAVGRNARAWLRLAPPSPCDHLLAAICVPGFTDLRIRIKRGPLHMPCRSRPGSLEQTGGKSRSGFPDFGELQVQPRNFTPDSAAC